MTKQPSQSPQLPEPSAPTSELRSDEANALDARSRRDALAEESLAHNALEEATAAKDAGVAEAQAETPTPPPLPPLLQGAASNGPQTHDTEPRAAQLEAKQAQTSVARSAGVVSLAVMGSRVLGLVREQIFAAYFGAGFIYDAFQVGFRIPNTLRDLFAEGALSAAFVKTFTDYSLKRSEAEAWRLASLVMNALAIILSIITIIGIIFSPQIVALIAAGFSPEKARLATTLTRIMFPFILLVALAAVAMGVLNTKKRFGIPASASTLFNVGSIVGGLIFAFWLSGGGWTTPTDVNAVPSQAAQWAMIGMAIGTLIGGALQFLIQVPSLYAVGFRFRPIVSFTDPGVRQVMRLMGPAIIGTSAVQVNVLVNTLFASGIDGGQSWLSYAFRLMQFPIGVFGVAIGTATLPTISRFAAEIASSPDALAKFRSTLASSITLVFVLTIPSACGLVVLGRPIINLIYERGAFTSVATEMVAAALAAYSIGLAGYAAIKVLSPAFYALGDARTPMIVSLISIVVNAAASYVFRDWFARFGVTPQTPDGYGHVGLALATSCVALINFFVLVFFMRRRIAHFEGRRILSSLLRIMLASALLSAVSYATYRGLFAVLGGGNFVARLIETFVPIAVGGLTFLVAARMLKLRELDQALRPLTRRLGINL